jgi:hypothetical protein
MTAAAHTMGGSAPWSFGELGRQRMIFDDI